MFNPRCERRKGIKRMSISAEIDARVWCALNDVNVLQVCVSGATQAVVVAEYTVTSPVTGKKVWPKMAALVSIDTIMLDLKREVERARVLYEASIRQRK